MDDPRAARRTYAYKQAAKKLRALGLPCWLCGRPINYETAGADVNKDPHSFTVDHETPLSKGGDLLDPANLRAAHRRCNGSKGNRPVQTVPNKSRNW